MEFNREQMIFSLIRKILLIFSVLVIVFIGLDLIAGADFSNQHIIGIAGVILIQAGMFFLNRIKDQYFLKKLITTLVLFIFIGLALFN